MDLSDFQPIDTSKPFDLEHYLEEVPLDVQMRGHSPLRMAERAGPAARALVAELEVRAFAWYPTRDVMRWCA